MSAKIMGLLGILFPGLPWHSWLGLKVWEVLAAYLPLSVLRNVFAYSRRLIIAKVLQRGCGILAAC